MLFYRTLQKHYNVYNKTDLLTSFLLTIDLWKSKTTGM